MLGFESQEILETMGLVFRNRLQSFAPSLARWVYRYPLVKPPMMSETAMSSSFAGG